MSGSNVSITGSTGILGNTTITGSLRVTSITGSLYGTSSFAITASYTKNVSGGTDGYIPLWKGASALTSSCLYQDDINDTLYSYNLGNPKGLLLDFGNEIYTFGDSTSLMVDNVSGNITSNNNGFQKGLLLDFIGNTYSLGDHIGFQNSTYLKVDDNNQRITIPNGNVGIGTTSPSFRLDVSGSINATSEIFANNLAGIVFNTASVGDVRLRGDNDGTGLDGGDYILKTGLPYYGDVITDNYLANQGTLSGSFARVGIGTISPSYRLELSTDSAAKPSTNTWTITSDSRVKENVKPYTKGLDVISQINPVTYDYNGKAGFEKTKGNIGVIAQDVKDILPESISTYLKKLNEEDKSETELYNFNSHALTYVLINAIKELKAEIDLLKAQK
jgi:hypothetical protein